MSVRNYSVKNYSKIAPFPPSTKTFTDNRIASKRIYDLRKTTYKGKPTRDGGDCLDSSDIENEYPNKPVDLPDGHDSVYRDVIKHTDKPRQITKIPTNVNKYASNYLRNNVVQPDIMTTRDNKPRNRKNGGDTKSMNKHRPDQSGQSARAVSEYTTPSKVEQYVSTTENTKQRSLRPKSARPESRWERRLDAEEDESMYENSVKPSRPKSARPTSRMMRMIEAHPDVDYNFLNDLPPRPKTSHARRASIVQDEVESDPNEPLGRPKSRLGWETQVLKIQDSDSGSDEDSYMAPSSDRGQIRTTGSKNKRDKHSKSNKKTRPKSDRDTQYVDHGGNYGNYSHNTPVYDIGPTMYDLNSKIDDIDLDVDPVAYFMQDDTMSNRGVGKKPSLSKDVIQHIGGTRKSHQDKAITGYHGYYQNKQNLKADVTDRYHGNVFQSPQYSMSEGNERCINQDVPQKINRNVVNAKQHSLANGNVYQPRGVKNALKFSKAEVSRDILAKYTALGATNGPSTQADMPPLAGEEYKRKPRKLDPISRRKINPS